MTFRYLIIIVKILKKFHERFSRNLVSKSLRVDRDPPRSAKSQVGQIAKISQKFSVFRGLLGRYASVTDHIAPGCSPHVYYEPAKDEDHRPTGDRVGPTRNPGLQPTSPATVYNSSNTPKSTEIDRNPGIDSSSELRRSWKELWCFLDVQPMLQADCERFRNRSAPPELTILVVVKIPISSSSI